MQSILSNWKDDPADFRVVFVGNTEALAKAIQLVNASSSQIPTEVNILHKLFIMV